VAEFEFFNALPSIAPEVGLTILAIVVLALDIGFLGIPALPESQKHRIAYVASLGMALLAITPFIWHPSGEQALYWGGMIRHDTLSQVFKVTVMIAGAITALMAVDTTELGRRGEFYLIIIVSTIGACLLSASADLIMVFIALETITIPLYILAGFRKNDAKSTESGLKYFLFGAFTSAIMLYGFSLIYGFSGQTNLYAIADFLGSPEFGDHAIPLLISLVFVLVGFGFKISAVPFHFWTPDVYEGAPTPVTAYISVASKAASFALAIRFLIAVFPIDLVVEGQLIHNFWVQFVIAASILSMTLGNVLALSQRNIKRLLAYSSIAQAGYTLIGVAAVQASDKPEVGVAAVAFYMFMYTFTNLLAFGVIAIFAGATGSETIADLGGLNRRNPWMALAMTVALLSLGGIPPTAGFFGKFFLFNAAVNAHLEWLAIIGVINAIIGLYYYLVVIKVIYVDRTEHDDEPIALPVTGAWVLGITTVAVLILGIIPQAVLDWATQGAASLFQI
jgi:NADH-quinone oxidoreductase subunit N